MGVADRGVDARLGMAVASARCISGVSRLFGIGGGTAAPGRVANRVDPRALEKLAHRLAQGVVVVAGTNGKTTTARLLAEILAADHRHVVHNRAGANLVGGIVSTLAADATDAVSSLGIAVLETDEAAFPEVLDRTSPRLIVLTNLFRDQLDRFGEVDLIIESWRQALQGLTDASTLVVNADDPALVELTRGLDAQRVYFGIRDSRYQLTDLPHAAETIACPRCQTPFTYRAIFVGHLGDWLCTSCSVSRPPLDVSGHAIELRTCDFQTLELSGLDRATACETRLPGLYNTYNVITAMAAANVLGVPASVSQQSVARYRGAFGRAEQVMYRGRSLMIMLVKNPVGYNEVLRTIVGADGLVTLPVLLCLNDGPADGRDVSWIWDVDFELLAPSHAVFSCAGTRWADLRNRLYYAGVRPERVRALGPDVGKAVTQFTADLPARGPGFVLPTYSAMLAVRRALARHHHLPAFWDE